MPARIRRTIGSSTALVVLGLTALLAMNELSRLIGEVLAADGHTHTLAAVIGLGAGSELDAWADWRSAAFSPMAFIVAHSLVDLLFVTAYGVLGYRLFRFGELSTGRSAARPLVLLYSVIAFDLLEDLLVVTLALTPDDQLPVVLAIASGAKWAATVVLVLYALLFLPALLGIAYVVVRWRRPVTIVEETAAVDNPFAELEALLEKLEAATLDERDVAELEALAVELEAAASRLERVA